MEKRQSNRAIIIEGNQLVAMYREKENKVYYTFPGGGIEDGETNEECVKREVLEEFGIQVRVKKLCYTYENSKTIQKFYLCDWIDGELGTGEGEEFQKGRNNGIYMPCMIEISKLPKTPLMPTEVSKFVYYDFKKFGKELDSVIKSAKVEN